MNKIITIKVELTNQEAWDLAQFIKRLQFFVFQDRAVNRSEDEAYRMRDAVNKVNKELQNQGICPR